MAARLGGDADGPVAAAEMSGPGFVNITLRDGWIAGASAGQLADPRLGVPLAGLPQRVVVDYSGPNVAKELHAGHLRVTVVGDAIVRVLEFLGHTVIRAAHLGDWGTQFGMMIEHALDIGDAATAEQLASGQFTAFYQDARSKFDADPGFAGRSRRRVVELQAGDPPSLRLWQTLVDDSLAYLHEVYARLDITLTDADMDPESFYNPMLADVCAELEGKGIAVISDGPCARSRPASPAGTAGRCR